MGRTTVFLSFRFPQRRYYRHHLIGHIHDLRGFLAETKFASPTEEESIGENLNAPGLF